MIATSESRRARLIEYAPWMFRDYMTNQGPATAIVVVLIGFTMLMPLLEGASGAPMMLGRIPEPVSTAMLRGIMPFLAFIGAFFATNGIIANDRKFGYFRLLFAKPVSPPSYYAVTFATYGGGFLFVVVVLLGIWSITVRPTFPIELLVIVALMYVAYGGLGFLLSAVWRFDWLSLVTVVVVADTGWRLWGNTSGIRYYLLHLLPPVHRAGDLYALVANDTVTRLPWPSIAWLGGYGLACFLLGILVVHKRPLGTS